MRLNFYQEAPRSLSRSMMASFMPMEMWAGSTDSSRFSWHAGMGGAASGLPSSPRPVLPSSSWCISCTNPRATVFVIYSVKGSGIVNKAEIDVFLELSCFFHDPADVGYLISGSSLFLNPIWTSGSSWFMYYWNLAWRILSITLLACEMSAIVQ